MKENILGVQKSDLCWIFSWPYRLEIVDLLPNDTCCPFLLPYHKARRGGWVNSKCTRTIWSLHLNMLKMSCEQPSNRMLPTQQLRQKLTLVFLGSLSLVCALEQGKRKYRRPIMADRVIMIAGNSSYKAVTSLHTGGRWSGEKVLSFQTPQLALLIQYTGAISCTEPVRLNYTCLVAFPGTEWEWNSPLLQ